VNISPQRANDSSAIQSQDLEHSSDARVDAAPKNERDVNGEASRRRYERIAKAAYQRAQQRAFAPGGEVDDWLAAERELDAGGASLRD
jgi:hypothetical protein